VNNLVWFVNIPSFHTRHSITFILTTVRLKVTASRREKVWLSKGGKDFSPRAGVETESPLRIHIFSGLRFTGCDIDGNTDMVTMHCCNMRLLHPMLMKIYM
jgi:hypothetical protein